jgi:hypothetical protein
VELSRLTQKNEALQLELQDQKLKNKLKMRTGAKDDDADGRLRLRHLSQSFTLSSSLWIRTRPDNLAPMRLPTAYDPSTRFTPNTNDPKFDAVQHELHGVIYELGLLLKEGEQHYVTSDTVLRTVSLFIRPFE